MEKGEREFLTHFWWIPMVHVDHTESAMWMHVSQFISFTLDLRTAPYSLLRLLMSGQKCWQHKMALFMDG